MGSLLGAIYMSNQCECNFDGFTVIVCENCKKDQAAPEEAKLNAGDIMESLLTNRFYQRMKMAETHTTSIKSEIRKNLESSEQKRHEYKEHNLVAKFVSKKVFDTDYLGLNEFLDDRGLLVPVVKFNHKEIKKDPLLLDVFAPYQISGNYKLHIAFNKEGKKIKEFPTKEFDGLAMNDLFHSFSTWDSEHKRLVSEYESVKLEMLACPLFEQEKKISHKYGSLSKVALDPSYNIEQIYQELGSDFLIRYGKPEAEKLTELVYKGYLSQKDIDQFKQLKDIRLDFMIMSLDTEERMLSMLNHKKVKAAQSRLIG